MGPAPRLTVAGSNPGWRERALGTSRWLAAQEGLPEYARALFSTNFLARNAAAQRARNLLSGRVPVRRLLQVGFEVFVQVLALGLDLRDASKSSETGIRSWAADRRRTGTLPDRILARIEAGGALERPEDGTSPFTLATARRLRICLETLGPTYVKFGQLLGSAHGLLPEEVVAEFSRCHDEVRPHPTSGIIDVIEADLGPLAHNFSFFDPEPLASASIAQVHAARLRSGQEVAVKVQRPNVRRRLEADVAVLHRLAMSANDLELVDTLNLVGMSTLFCETVVEELDFRLEAESMIELAMAFEESGHLDVRVPHPVPGLVTERVLVMERLHGSRLGEASDRAVEDPAALLRVGTQAVLEAALTYGVFHADMHAGNMLALDDGKYALLDYGIVGRFDEAQRWALGRWIASLATEDLPLQIEALGQLGAFPPGTDLGTLADQVEVVLRKIETEDPERLGDIAHDFELIARILSAHGLRLPTELALFLKNLLHVTGQARQLAPEDDPMEASGILPVARSPISDRDWPSAHG